MADLAPRDARPARANKLVIDPSLVELDSEGFCFRTWRVRLPEGVTLAHLNENANTGLWQLVQSRRDKALRKMDRLVILPYGEEWIVDAIVGAANASSVTLAGIKKTDMPARYETLPETDDFRVKWYGSGYAVERKKDGQRVTDIVPTVHEAGRDMRNRYSRAAA